MDPPESPNPSTPGEKLNEEEEKKARKVFEEPTFCGWDESEVASYIIERLPKEGNELNEREKKERDSVRDFIIANEINGRKLNEMTEGEWKQVVREELSLMITLPGDFAARSEHPLLTTLIKIPQNLRAASQGIWCMALSCFLRVPQYDQTYSTDDVWCHSHGDRPYFNPAGWTRYGFYPKKEGETKEQVDEIFKTWHVAYHGTKFKNTDSIVKHGLVPPGTTVNGKMVENEHGHAGAESNKVPIYVSPSIEYSSHWVYTTPVEADRGWFYSVFQVRVRPGSFKVQGNTFWKGGWEDRTVLYDRKFGPDELEWLVNNSDDIRVTGLMIKKEVVPPDQLVKEKFEIHKGLCSKRRGEGQGKWFFNCAETGGPTLSELGPFQAYKEEESVRIEKAYQNWQSLFYLGNVETDIGINPFFINFEKMEQIRCDDNTLRRRVKREAIPSSCNVA